VQPALFIPSGQPGRFTATELARGPWDPQAQHGGAPAALLIRELERLPTPDRLILARVTFELLRPVPLGDLAVRSEVVRPGRRVQVLEASLWAGEVEVMRARALQVAGAEAPASEPSEPPAGPDHGVPNDLEPHFRPMFAPDAVEVRFVSGQFSARGPATAWFRLRVPVVHGERASPLQRVAAAGDFGNGISAPVSWDDYVFINPDLTLYLERSPRGEWIALQSQTTIRAGGIGISESVLYDVDGRIGRATQALLVAPRTPAT
jgi:hypothetical protein